MTDRVTDVNFMDYCIIYYGQVISDFWKIMDAVMIHDIVIVEPPV